MTSIHFVIALCEWCSSKLLQNWVTSFPWKTPNAFHNFQINQIILLPKFCVPTIIVWLAKTTFLYPYNPGKNHLIHLYTHYTCKWTKHPVGASFWSVLVLARYAIFDALKPILDLIMLVNFSVNVLWTARSVYNTIPRRKVLPICKAQ